MLFLAQCYTSYCLFSSNDLLLFQISSNLYFLCLQASCRRNFSLDVVLLNASGQPVNKDVEVYISDFCISYN